MSRPNYFKVDDIITRSPHIKRWFKAKYRKEVRERIRESENGE